jgi:hypothetical protein
MVKKKVSIINYSFFGKRYHCYLNNTIVVCLKYAFPDCCKIFSHPFIGSWRSFTDPHSMNLHCMLTVKKEHCTWLCAFLPMSCRVQIQGEKLCRIICIYLTKKQIRKHMHGCAAVRDEIIDQHSKEAGFKELIFFYL